MSDVLRSCGHAVSSSAALRLRAASTKPPGYRGCLWEPDVTRLAAMDALRIGCAGNRIRLCWHPCLVGPSCIASVTRESPGPRLRWDHPGLCYLVAGRSSGRNACKWWASAHGGSRPKPCKKKHQLASPYVHPEYSPTVFDIDCSSDSLLSRVLALACEMHYIID